MHGWQIISLTKRKENDFETYGVVVRMSDEYLDKQNKVVEMRCPICGGRMVGHKGIYRCPDCDASEDTARRWDHI